MMLEDPKYFCPNTLVYLSTYCLEISQIYRALCEILEVKMRGYWPLSWSEALGSRFSWEHSLMFNVAVRCWDTLDKLDSQQTANVLSLDLLPPPPAISSPQLGVQSQHYRPSTEITSVEKPAMLMVAILAITNIKCNTLLYTTRFIQAAGTQCQGRLAQYTNLFGFIWLSSNLSTGL